MRETSILLVEDDTDDRDLALRVLQRQSIAREIVVAADGAVALDYLFGTGEYASRRALGQPDLLLLDLKLPKLDGLEVLKRVRGDSRTRRVPVVVLTSSDDDRDVARSYDLGASSYVRKPVAFSSFAAALEQVERYWLQLNVRSRSVDTSA